MLRRALHSTDGYLRNLNHNWDSAWDGLTNIDITDFTLYLNKVEKINTEDFNVFKPIIKDACEDFGELRLWIVGDSDPAFE
ncbi:MULTISPECIES: hypothetical protein [unclassified Psychrobacter]|uniref:hypothetical protein n=1 Tax=unclassified Psychrobacter TaxID=196806 RepID=UPI0025FE40D0|nr:MULTISPECIES: hypothetical protein [unclassified Psychrobacter]